jgi:hypothetical protein
MGAFGTTKRTNIRCVYGNIQSFTDSPLITKPPVPAAMASKYTIDYLGDKNANTLTGTHSDEIFVAGAHRH